LFCDERLAIVAIKSSRGGSLGKELYSGGKEELTTRMGTPPLTHVEGAKGEENPSNKMEGGLSSSLF